MSTNTAFEAASGSQPRYRTVNRASIVFFRWHGYHPLRPRVHRVLTNLVPCWHDARSAAEPINSHSRRGLTLWVILFVIQAALIFAHQMRWHRSLGVVPFCLPLIMVLLGALAAADSLRRGAQIGPLNSLTSVVVSLFSIAGFCIVIYASWRPRRRPDAHSA
jgi:hypothetical protein